MGSLGSSEAGCLFRTGRNCRGYGSPGIEGRALDGINDDAVRRAVQGAGKFDRIGEAEAVGGSRQELPGEFLAGQIDPVDAPRRPNGAAASTQITAS